MDFLRAHVVGSMLRPAQLKQQLPLYRRGEIDPADFKSVEDKAVDEAIRSQEAAGIQLITDGEQRRLAFGDVFVRSMGLMPTGMQQAGASGGLWHGDAAKLSQEINNPMGGVIVEKLRRENAAQAIEEFVYARARAKVPIKVTLPSPTMFMAAWVPGISDKAYPKVDAALKDVIEILQDLVRALARLGCRHIQFDAPEMTFAIAPESSPALRANGLSREAFCKVIVGGLTAVAVEPGVTFSVHFCRGNARGLWHSTGAYDAISPLVFPHLGGFRYVLLEYDTERAGSFAALRDLPHTCCAVLGLVTTKSGTLEDRSAVNSRIETAADYVPLERLALSPQCGFASDVGGNSLDFAQQQAKLELVGSLAREIWVDANHRSRQ